MRRPFIIEPSKEYEFIVGQLDKFLIMRNLTSNIILRSDTFDSDLTLSRSDTVDVSMLERVKMKFVNETDVVIAGEFQLSPLDIRIKEQKMNVDGSVVVSEISEPVEINSIAKPVTVKEILLPVEINSIAKPITVNEILLPVEIKKENIKHSFKTVPLKGGDSYLIPEDGANIVVTSIQVIANSDNEAAMGFFDGVVINPGMCWELNQNLSGGFWFTLYGKKTDNVILFYTYDEYSE